MTRIVETSLQNLEQDQLDRIAVAHRLEAARFLGWEWIDAVILDANSIDWQVWEIDENLIRSELSPSEQAEHLAKRKELWAQRDVVAQVEPKPQGGRPKQFAADTSETTGMPKSTINLAENIPNSILVSSKAVAGLRRPIRVSLLHVFQAFS